MTHWPSTRARLVHKALIKIGWTLVSQRGSHQKLRRSGFPDYTWAFHDREEIGPKMLARIAKHTGLTPKDL
ncbi:MAG: type II toxin-antitoxin system HicA family toxin [Acidobacteriia bacterium]|nr:type II toxin-antitoxin system HicA family toxin [Terriglobia bacterium]